MQQKKLSEHVLRELSQYRDVFSHHVETILKSQLLLDEDANLLLNYWDDNYPFKETKTTKWEIFTGCLAVAGLISSFKLRTYLFSVFTIPFISQLWCKCYKCVCNYKAKEKFENLVYCLSNLHELNLAVLKYFRNRNIAFTNYYTSRNENFMNYFYCVLLEVLEELKGSIIILSENVPVIDSNNAYVASWDLELFKSNNFNNHQKTLVQLEKMSDVYVLMVSSFLSCVGLSLCVNLWKNSSCDFKIVFKSIVPSLLTTIEKSIQELSLQFKQVRYTLEDKKQYYRNDHSPAKNKMLSQLGRPLENLLSHLQIIFEMVKYLEICLGMCSDTELGRFTTLVSEINSQFNICEDDLHSFVQNYEIVIRQQLNKGSNKDVIIKDTPMEDEKLEEPAVNHRDEENIPDSGEDEEYNLYIGYSDDEEEYAPNVNYVDQMSTEYLELMLQELKKKLEERKRLKRGFKDIEEGNSIDRITPSTEKNTVRVKFNLRSDYVPPPPPLPDIKENIPSASQLDPQEGTTSNSASTITQSGAAFESPMSDEFQMGFFNSIKTLAQQLNRKEETFGFGDDSATSESDEN